MSHVHPSSELSLRTALTASDMESLRALFLRYRTYIGVDLCFQDFETELATLPGAYSAPSGGAFLARIHDIDGGCCAFRAIGDVDYPNACEMKRLFVDPAFRGFGLGQRLVEHTMLTAKAAGYAYMLLDTLVDMEAARSLYHEAGFYEIAPYYYNPLPGTHYLAAEL